MRHDSFGEARVVALRAGLFLWLAGGARRVVRSLGRGLFAPRTADRATEKLWLILHHVEALAAPRRRRLASGGLHGLNHRLGLLDDGWRGA